MRPMCAVRMGALMVAWLLDWLVGRSVVSGHSMDREFRVGVCCMASWGVAVCIGALMCAVAGVAEAQEPTSAFTRASRVLCSCAAFSRRLQSY